MREHLTAPDDEGFPLDLHAEMVFDAPRLASFERAFAALSIPCSAP